ncbi:MAG TPA: hypothetical protein VK694_06165 [Verrucomicrobiae bacterium]|nr:hypothetical protein [Verrucomicrobiae bacterium]
MEQPQPSMTEIQERVDSLPMVDAGPLLDHKAALAALHALRRRELFGGNRLAAQIDATLDDTTQQLGQDRNQPVFTVTSEQLRGIVARAMITGIGQVAYDVGGAQQTVEHLQQLFNMDTVDEPPIITDTAPEGGM